MILRLLACLVLAVLVFIAAGGLLSAATAAPPLRGAMVDIGDGRRLHIICEGPPAGTNGPTIVFEAGAFDVATLFFSKFRSVIAQIPTAQRIIPAEIPAGTKATDAVYDYEPDEGEIAGRSEQAGAGAHGLGGGFEFLLGERQFAAHDRGDVGLDVLDQLGNV